MTRKPKIVQREIWRAEYPYGNRLIVAASFNEAFEIAKLDTGQEPDNLGRADIEVIEIKK